MFWNYILWVCNKSSFRAFVLYVIARRALPDVAISNQTTGDPHVAIAPRDDGGNKCVGISSLLTFKPKVYNSVMFLYITMS